MITTYDQEAQQALNALLEKLDVKQFDALEYEIEQIKYYTAIRTQMIENLSGELQRVSSNFKNVLDEINDDDDYFESAPSDKNKGTRTFWGKKNKK